MAKEKLPNVLIENERLTSSATLQRELSALKEALEVNTFKNLLIAAILQEDDSRKLRQVGEVVFQKKPGDTQGPPPGQGNKLVEEEEEDSDDEEP